MLARLLAAFGLTVVDVTRADAEIAAGARFFLSDQASLEAEFPSSETEVPASVAR